MPDAGRRYCVCGHIQALHNENGCLVDDRGGYFVQPCWCEEFAPASDTEDALLYARAGVLTNGDTA